MMPDADAEKIAALVMKKIEQHRVSFWIEPEQHYQDHIEMRSLLTAFNESKSIFLKTFLGLLVIGGLFIAMVALGAKKILGID